MIFDKVRLEKGGGGIAVAARTELNPVLLSEAEGVIDAITIDISTRNMIISCTSAYGPQTTATKETKNKFWDYLSNAASSAKIAGKGFIMQGDLYSTLGNTIIPGDKNPKN